jgi:hypothetical protein
MRTTQVSTNSRQQVTLVTTKGRANIRVWLRRAHEMISVVNTNNTNTIKRFVKDALLNQIELFSGSRFTKHLYQIRAAASKSEVDAEPMLIIYVILRMPTNLGEKDVTFTYTLSKKYGVDNVLVPHPMPPDTPVLIDTPLLDRATVGGRPRRRTTIGPRRRAIQKTRTKQRSNKRTKAFENRTLELLGNMRL